MPVRTLDIEKLHHETGNLYELISIMSKRSRQISSEEKLELDEKLRYFEGFDDDDDIRMNEEQEKICKIFEERPHPTQRSVNEMSDNKIAWKRPSEY